MNLKVYKSKFACLVRPSIVLLLALTHCSDALAQEDTASEEGTAVINVDFDDHKPEYSFGLSYGGYAARGSDELITINETLSNSSEVIAEAGNKGAAMVVTLDISKVEVPPADEVEFAYLAVGAGMNGSLIEGDLSEIDFADYQVAFDAKIENGKTMKQSRIELQFITTDGKGPEEDEDSDDDLLCKLKYAGSQSDKEIKLTSEFQTFTVEIADMSIAEGSIELVKEHEARGATLIVVAEDSPENFGVKGETKLIVDNFRLIKK